MIFEEITEEVLNEKLITYNNRKPYGQVVFVAGGAGSGKGFAIKNFMDSSSFKIRDVDEMKKQIQILDRLEKLSIDSLIDKYGRSMNQKDIDLLRRIQDDGYSLKNMDLKKPDHVYALHMLVKATGVKEAWLGNILVGNSNPKTLPNIMFDMTLKNIFDATTIIPSLLDAGYLSKNIHLTWVLTDYKLALQQNKERERRVPEDILLKTHEGAANTVWGMVTRALPKGMDGRVDVILNNREHTVYFKDLEGDKIKTKASTKSKNTKRSQYRGTGESAEVIKGFMYLPVKKAGGGFYPEKKWQEKLFNWIRDNAPSSIASEM